MHWNKPLSLTDYDDLRAEADLVTKHNKEQPEWMFIHSDAIHRCWEYASMYKFITEHLPIRSRIVEFGSAASPGQATPMAPLLALAGMDVVVSDMVPWVGAGVKKQREVFDRSIECLLQDGRYMALQSESVDFVCSISVIEHIAGDLKVFEESARVVRPGGYIGFTCDFSNPDGSQHGMYDQKRLTDIIALLGGLGFQSVDEPDYTSTENHVFWARNWYNFARCNMRKK